MHELEKLARWHENNRTLWSAPEWHPCCNSHGACMCETSWAAIRAQVDAAASAAVPFVLVDISSAFGVTR